MQAGKLRKIYAVAFLLTTINLIALAPLSAAAQDASPNILATLNFNPKADGYSFENYDNKNRNWQNDLTNEDLIRMFGSRAVCKTGSDAQSCVAKTSAAEWMAKQLKAMNGGHCEGMAATSLRLKSGLPFKDKSGAPDSFQPAAARPFDLRLDEIIGNYIAYYFVTQSFDEIARPTQASGRQGPLFVVNTLINSMKSPGGETYTLGFYKFDPATGRKFDGHAITPIAVEDAGNAYRIHVYDNNYPGETRYVVVDKGERQAWKYVTSTNPSEPAAEYAGDIATKTLEITPSSAREKTCYEAPFADANEERQCAASVPAANLPIETKGSLGGGEMAEFFLDDAGDLLITTADGKNLGYDPDDARFYEDIEGAEADLIVGGRGKDLPHYKIPVLGESGSYTVTFSGKHLREESETDFIYSAPNLTIGFNNVRLDPQETLTATISPDGKEISFTASDDGETPEIYFAFDPENDSEPSYIARVGGVKLDAGKTLTAAFDLEAGKMQFNDDDDDRDAYDIDLVRVNADGTEQEYHKDDLNLGEGGDNYEMDFKNWDGQGEMCFRQDKNGDGFEDEKCQSQDGNEDKDDDDDN